MARAPKLGAGAGGSTGRRAVPLPMKVGTGGNAPSTGVRGLRGTGRKAASASLGSEDRRRREGEARRGRRVANTDFANADGGCAYGDYLDALLTDA